MKRVLRRLPTHSFSLVLPRQPLQQIPSFPQHHSRKQQEFLQTLQLRVRLTHLLVLRKMLSSVSLFLPVQVCTSTTVLSWRKTTFSHSQHSSLIKIPNTNKKSVGLFRRIFLPMGKKSDCTICANDLFSFSLNILQIIDIENLNKKHSCVLDNIP